MSLSKLLGRLISRTSNTTAEDRIANLSRLEQSKHHLLKMDARPSRSIDLMVANRIQVTTVDRDIHTLTRRILQYVETINARETLVSSNFFSEYHVVTLDSFFIDEDGCYISVGELVSFVDSCKLLYSILDSIKESDPNIYAYANRLLTKTFASIQNVSLAVLEASD